MTSVIYRFDEFRLDPARHELWRGGEELTLPLKVFSCIVYLIENRDRAIGRDELIEAVWGDVHLTDSALGQAIQRARQALGDNGDDQHVIQTVRGFGYRWAAAVKSMERSGTAGDNVTEPPQPTMGNTDVNLEIDLLRALVAFADSGTFEGAAQLVFRPQSAVRMQIKTLEELVGQPLMTRRGRDMVLTEHGTQLGDRARQIVALHDKVVQELHREEVTGQVRIGIPDDYAMRILPHVLQQLADHYPNVSLDITANTTPILLKRLANGQLDFAIFATRTPDEEDVILMTEPVVWVSSDHHDAHRRRPLVLALFSDESPIYRATIAALQSHAEGPEGSFEFRIGLKSKSWAVLTTAAASGFAVATMARCVVVPGLRILGQEEGFPDLGHIHIVMKGSPDSQFTATSRLAKRILDGFRKGPPITMPAEELTVMGGMSSLLSS